LPIICLVTGNRNDPSSTVNLIAAAGAAGVDIVQIRERNLDDRALLDLTRRAVAATRETACRIVVNERLDVALAGGASGVHLRGNSFAGSRVRGIVPEGFLIGRSVHGVAEARAIAREGACDYIVFGTVFSSVSKPAGHPVAGLDALAAVCDAVELPVLAIGGITRQNAGDAASAGASGIAAIGLFDSAQSMPLTVAALRRAFDT
jgi:thiamine-phosphate pyrophosphorylase